MKSATALFFLFAMPLMAAKQEIAPIPNESLFARGQSSDLSLKQQEFLGDEDLESSPRDIERNIQRQEETPSPIQIKEVKNPERRAP